MDLDKINVGFNVNLKGLTDGFKNAEREITKMKIAAGDLEGKLGGMGTKLISLGEGMAKLGKKMSLGLTLPMMTIGTVSFKMAADLEDSLGASGQIFKKASGEMERWANSLPSYYGVAKTEAIGYTNVMGSMLKNIGGLTEAEAAKQSQKLLQLSADLSAMFGGSTQNAVNALTGALKGNNTMLDNYGMGVNEATIKAKAFAMGIFEGTGQLTLQQKQAATLALIMEQTTDAQGQAAREAESASGSMKAFSTEIKNVSTQIGTILLPTITPMVKGVGKLVEAFGKMPEEMKKISIGAAITVASFGPLLFVTGNAIKFFSTFGTTVTKAKVALSTLSTMSATTMTSLSSLGLAVKGLLGPISLAVGAFALFIGVLWKAEDESAVVATSIGDKFAVLGERLAGLLQFTGAIALSAVGLATNGIIQIFKTGLSKTQDFLSGLKGISDKLGLDWLSEKLNGGVNGIEGAVKRLEGIQIGISDGFMGALDDAMFKMNRPMDSILSRRAKSGELEPETQGGGTRGFFDGFGIDSAEIASLGEAAKATDLLSETMKKMGEEFKQSAQKIKDSIGMFDGFRTKTSSAYQLLRNAQQRANAFTERENILNSLSGKGLSGDIMSGLYNTDISKLGDLKGLNRMSQEQLTQWASMQYQADISAERQAMNQTVHVETININATDKDVKEIEKELYRRLRVRGVTI